MDKQNDSVSAFDLLYTTNHIQMMKALIPCSPLSMQPYMAVFIKYLELSYTISCLKKPLLNACNISSNQNLCDILDGVQKYLSDNEKKQLQQIESLYKNFEQMKEIQKMMDFIKPDAQNASDDFLSSFLSQSQENDSQHIQSVLDQIFSSSEHKQ